MKMFSTFQIAPNPANEHLNIRVETLPGKTTYTVINPAGQQIQTLESSKQEVTLNVADLPKGMYYLRVQNGDHQSVKKFVKY